MVIAIIGKIKTMQTQTMDAIIMVSTMISNKIKDKVTIAIIISNSINKDHLAVGVQQEIV
jgi:hypothetical protein